MLCLFYQNKILMAETPKSQRQLLISRVQKQRLADSLSKNLEKLSNTQERLSSSRLSSASSSSLHSIRRAYSAMSINKKSDSREFMLRQIIEKLKDSRRIINTTPSQKIEVSQKEINGSSGKKQTRSKVNKLQEMMKDIKKCNQMSTKAIYTIKKNAKEEHNFSSQAYQNNTTQQPNKQAQNSIIVLINELASVKEELLKIKKENKELRDVIRDSRQQKQREESCRLCSCQCHFPKK